MEQGERRNLVSEVAGGVRGLSEIITPAMAFAHRHVRTMTGAFTGAREVRGRRPPLTGAEVSRELEAYKSQEESVSAAQRHLLAVREQLGAARRRNQELQAVRQEIMAKRRQGYARAHREFRTRRGR